MGTKQLQQPVDASGLGTPNSWKMVTSSGETMMSLEVPSVALRLMIMFATVRGVARQFSISRSTPSRLYLSTMPLSAAMKLAVVVELANTLGQFPFCPPTEMITFFPLACHLLIRVVGKLASSASTLPSGWVLTNARITVVVLGCTSSSVDWPQKLPPNPQQNMDRSQADAVKMPSVISRQR